MHYDAIYLSPHLDDAALSCGGQIWQRTAVQQHKILIVTITAGDPPLTVSHFANQQHNGWQLHKIQHVVSARRAEDKQACQILGAQALHWHIQDCIYRVAPQTNTPFYISDDDIFGTIHPLDKTLIQTIAKKIKQLPPHNQLFLPLTLGNHVDHQITRIAAEQAQTAPLYYYEDYPYAQKKDALTHMWLQQQQGNWQTQTITLSEQAIQARIQAVEAYQSQLNTLFGSQQIMHQQVNNYVNEVNGERIWYKTN